MTLEDTRRNVIYVPISKEMIPELCEWSQPVQFKVEEDSQGDLMLTFRPVNVLVRARGDE